MSESEDEDENYFGATWEHMGLSKSKMIQERSLPPITQKGLILSRSPKIEEIYEKLQLAEEKLKEGKSSSPNAERIRHFHHGILALRGLDFGEGLNEEDVAVTRNWKLSQLTEEILRRVKLVNENLRLELVKTLVLSKVTPWRRIRELCTQVLERNPHSELAQRFLDLANSRILPELPPISSSPPTKTRREKPQGKEASSSLPHSTNLATTRNSLRHYWSFIHLGS
ncbi:Oidioi.mRNA.OKI2018_I69.chr1.g1703.t1.cds [Oikopleura dioica]|uniref:Oidioi.mRNA.OKI2018_I69.chr1.g1703.t1.cds n=1 Tax=Oikopleura dioica TaxID=34765 RepID=A0ABN7SP83_OIKDI|nr:Oidioi.mRNA.OKI2018_I69.chr1.g1703.t1.cds [Oikopleura dioica]